jgi:hypothetical protein
MHKMLGGVWVACTTGAEYGPPLGQVDFAVEAKPGSAAPPQAIGVSPRDA